MRRAYLRTLLGLCSAGLLGSCSLTAGFDGFKFHAGDAGAADGGDGSQAGSGTGTNAGRGAAGGSNGAGSGSTAGNAARGGNGAGGSAGTSGGRGVIAAGSGGQAGPASCTLDADCGDTRTFQCVKNMCSVRRVPTSVWVSGGGGITRSKSFNVRVSTGAPAPLGSTQSEHYSVTVGAGAGRP